MIEKLIENLKKDKDYYYSWQANIAMAFQDAYHWHKTKTKRRPNLKDIHEISNTAAKHFLDLLCKSEAKPMNNVWSTNNPDIGAIQLKKKGVKD